MFESLRASAVSLWSFVRRFSDHKDGVAAVEFVLIFPILLIIVAASIDLSEALAARRKATQIASTMAGFLADQSHWKRSEIEDLMSAGSFILRPFNTDDLAIVLSVLEVSKTGDVKISASHSYGTTALAAGADSPIEVPNEIRSSEGTLVLAQVEYPLVTTFSSLWPAYAVAKGFDLSAYYFARPRRSTRIIID